MAVKKPSQKQFDEFSEASFHVAAFLTALISYARSPRSKWFNPDQMIPALSYHLRRTYEQDAEIIVNWLPWISGVGPTADIAEFHFTRNRNSHLGSGYDELVIAPTAHECAMWLIQPIWLVAIDRSLFEVEWIEDEFPTDAVEVERVEARMSREVAAVGIAVGATVKPRYTLGFERRYLDVSPNTDRRDKPTEAEINIARRLCKQNPVITRDALKDQMVIGAPKATLLRQMMINEGIHGGKIRRSPSK